MKKNLGENGLLSGKRVLAATLVMVLLSSMTFFSAAAGHTWESQGNVEAIKSDGTKVTVFDKSDLDYLDGRIDAIEADVSTGKANLANALNPLGTNSSLSGTSTFNELLEAINHSQAIPDKTIGESASIAAEDYQLASTVTGQTINSNTKISAATAANLSLGTSAWVDGQLIVGTGSDNKNYYNYATSKLSTHTMQFLGSFNSIEVRTYSCIDIPNYKSLTSDNFKLNNVSVGIGGAEYTGLINPGTLAITAYNSDTGIVSISQAYVTGSGSHGQGYSYYNYDLYVIY